MRAPDRVVKLKKPADPVGTIGMCTDHEVAEGRRFITTDPPPIGGGDGP